MEKGMIYFFTAYLIVGFILAVLFSRKYDDFKLQLGSIYRITIATLFWPLLLIMELNDINR